MNAAPRLLEITDALIEAGINFLIMGGHAVRHYGLDRNTVDFDFHVSLTDAPELERRLRRTRFFSREQLTEGVSWRRADFRRFQIGVLPSGREEWLEFWFRNHLLAPFPEISRGRSPIAIAPARSGGGECVASARTRLRSASRNGRGRATGLPTRCQSSGPGRQTTCSPRAVK